MANVLYEPYPKQEEFLKAVLSRKYSYLLYGGAIRSGKTFAGLGTLLILCKLYPQSRWAIVRDSLPTLKRNTIPSFNKICPKSFIKSYNQDTQTVTFNNGSQIIFFAENYDDDKELNRWKGLEVSGFLLEECNELQKVSFDKAIERAGSYIPPNKLKKPKPLILATCNPSQGWVKETFYDPYERGTLSTDYCYIPAKITDNPAVTADADYMASLKNLPEVQYRIFVEGDWNVSLNEYPWLYAYDAKKHVQNVKFMSDMDVYLTFDINNDPFTCTAWQFSPIMGTSNSFIHCLHEFGGKIKAEEMCEQILQVFPHSIFHITGDRSGQNEDVARNKSVYETLKANLRGRVASLDLFTKNLEYNDSRMLMNSMFELYPHLYINPACEMLLKDIQKAEVDLNKGGGALLKDRQKGFKMDYFDNMRYFFQTYFLKFAMTQYINAVKKR